MPTPPTCCASCSDSSGCAVEVNQTDLNHLVAIVGAAHVLTDDDVRAGYEIDWTGRFRGRTPAVVRPGRRGRGRRESCDGRRTAAWPSFPRAATRVWSAAGFPSPAKSCSACVASTVSGRSTRLAGQITVGAGATSARVQDHVGRRRLRASASTSPPADPPRSAEWWPPTPAAPGVLRHGGMRAQIAGVEAVLGDGSVVAHLGGLRKDNTGLRPRRRSCAAARARSGSSPPCASAWSLPPVERRRCPPRSPRRGRRRRVLRRRPDGARRSRRPKSCSRRASTLCATTRTLPHPFASRPAAYLLLEAAGGTDPAGDLLAALGPVEARPRERPSPPTPLGAPSCGATAKPTPKPSTPSASPTSSTSPFPSVASPSSCDRDRRRGRRVSPTPSSACSATSATATSTSTSSTARPTADDRLDERRARRGGRDGREHQRRARHRHGQDALAPPQPHAGRAGGLPAHQGRPRPRRHPQPRGAATARGVTRPSRRGCRTPRPSTRRNRSDASRRRGSAPPPTMTSTRSASRPGLARRSRRDSVAKVRNTSSAAARVSRKW